MTRDTQRHSIWSRALSSPMSRRSLKCPQILKSPNIARDALMKPIIRAGGYGTRPTQQLGPQPLYMYQGGRHNTITMTTRTSRHTRHNVLVDGDDDRNSSRRKTYIVFFDITRTRAQVLRCRSALNTKPGYRHSLRELYFRGLLFLSWSACVHFSLVVG